MGIKAFATTATAAALLLACATGAPAAVIVSKSGSTLIVNGSNGADSPQFSYVPAAADGQPGYTRVFDPDGVQDPLPASCTRTDPADPQQAPANIAACEDGGTAPLLSELDLTLFDGADDPSISECFNTFVVDAGEGANHIVVPGCAGGTFSVTSGAGQDWVQGTHADPAATIAITANLGAGDDQFFGGDGPSLVHGGPGSDYLVGAAGDDQFFGDDGDDTMFGAGGNDSYDGGAGADTLGVSHGVSNDPDPGNDDYRGGPGADLLVLDGHTAGMTISLDEVANDGSSGEADNVHNDIESIRGTDKNDVFTGGPGNDEFEGNGGNDTIHGAGGDDDLYGGGGDDKMYGDAGTDKIQGAEGADTIDGGPGTDQLYGDRASCSAFCSFDADVLLSRDGERDTVDCGGGADTAQVDSLDVVAFCASVDTQPAGTQGPPPGAGGGAAFTFTAHGTSASITCPAACSFSMSIALSAKTARHYRLGRKALVIGKASGSLLAAGTKTVKVRLSKAAQRRLRHARRVPATLKVSARDAAGARSSKTKPIMLGRR